MMVHFGTLSQKTGLKVVIFNFIVFSEPFVASFDEIYEFLTTFGSEMRTV